MFDFKDFDKNETKILKKMKNELINNEVEILF
jgi:hypothetical protein